MKLEDIIVTLRADAAQFQSAMQSAIGSFRSMVTVMDGGATSINSAMQRIEQAASRMASNVVQSFAQAAAGPRVLTAAMEAATRWNGAVPNAPPVNFGTAGRSNQPSDPPFRFSGGGFNDWRGGWNNTSGNRSFVPLDASNISSLQYLQRQNGVSRGTNLGTSAFFNPNGLIPGQNQPGWFARNSQGLASGAGWNWGAAAAGGMTGRILGGPTAGMMGALGGGIGGGVGALGGAGAGIGLEWLVVKPISFAADIAVSGLKMIGEAGIQLGSKIIELGVAFEKTQAVFGVIAGSPAAGNELLKQVRSMAVQTPYTSSQLYPQAQMLLGMGVSADIVPSVLSRLGDIAGGDPYRLHRLALAYGQSKAAGRLVGYELRQFTEAGVGIGDFAAAAGMTERQFRDAMSATGGSQIGPEVVDRTLNRLTGPGGRFHGLSGTMNRMTGGQYSALQERLQMTGEEFGKSIIGREDVAGRLGRLSDKLNELAKSADQALPAVDELVKMGDALYETAANLVKDIAPGSWEELTVSMTKFGKETLPQVVQGVMELGGAFMKLLALSFRIVDVLSNAAFSPVDLVMNSVGARLLMPESVAEYNKTRQVGHDALVGLARGSGQAGDWMMSHAGPAGQNVAKAFGQMQWQDESQFFDRVPGIGNTATELLENNLEAQKRTGYDLANPPSSEYGIGKGRRLTELRAYLDKLKSEETSLRERAAVETAGGRPEPWGARNALNADLKRRALERVGAGSNPFLDVFARAFGVTNTPAGGYQSPALLESSRQQAMGLMPGDMEFGGSLRKHLAANPFSEYLADRGRIGRLSKSPFTGTPFGGFAGMGPELTGSEATAGLKDTVEKLKKALEIPVDPMETFGKRMKDIDMYERIKGGSFNAMLLGKRTPEGDMARFELLEKYQQNVEAQLVRPLPTTRFAGSVEAQDLLNQAANETKLWQLDVKNILETANELSKTRAEHAKRAADELEKLNKGKIVVKQGEEKQ